MGVRLGQHKCGVAPEHQHRERLPRLRDGRIVGPLPPTSQDQPLPGNARSVHEAAPSSVMRLTVSPDVTRLEGIVP